MNEQEAMLKDWMDRVEHDRGIIVRHGMLEVVANILRDAGADPKVMLGFELCMKYLNKGEII